MIEAERKISMADQQSLIRRVRGLVESGLPTPIEDVRGLLLVIDEMQQDVDAARIYTDQVARNAALFITRIREPAESAPEKERPLK